MAPFYLLISLTLSGEKGKAHQNHLPGGDQFTNLNDIYLGF
jgi:hypothetical protein